LVNNEKFLTLRAAGLSNGVKKPWRLLPPEIKGLTDDVSPFLIPRGVDLAMEII
jgi:hypothetical protein